MKYEGIQIRNNLYIYNPIVCDCNMAVSFSIRILTFVQRTFKLVSNIKFTVNICF